MQAYQVLDHAKAETATAMANALAASGAVRRCHPQQPYATVPSLELRRRDGADDIEANSQKRHVLQHGFRYDGSSLLGDLRWNGERSLLPEGDGKTAANPTCYWHDGDVGDGDAAAVGRQRSLRTAADTRGLWLRSHQRSAAAGPCDLEATSHC
mmetsp:Transcript_5964/g.9515  ORF Transcript_5964/g.9515 Transcript_5964/m.9515 type:complete len:154 (+) Transcript_5964:264-725(+)